MPASIEMDSEGRIIDRKFPNLNNSSLYPGLGITELANGSETYQTDKIWAFNNLINPQPSTSRPYSFFISQDSWHKLFNGLDSNNICWLPIGYEVFGFAFCLAFQKHEPIRAYFRIRTIIKHRSEKHSATNTISVKIDPNKIAYVDLNKIDNPTHWIDCVTFFDNLYVTPLLEVNKDVDKYKFFIRRNLSLFNRPTTNLKDVKARLQGIPKEKWESVGDNTAILQEGSVFGKNSPFLLNLWNEGVKGSMISIAWDKDEQLTSFIFSINPYGETSRIPCPVPYTACSS